MPIGLKGFQKGHKTFNGSEKGLFKKGLIPWNKGLKLQGGSGSSHPLWKGNEVGYVDYIYGLKILLENQKSVSIVEILI